MAALVALTEPGPWRPRTIELGDYHGVFDGDQLVAMAGERQKIPGCTEVSAVCTHPDARRRGLGAAVTAQVVRGILERGETPFLHHTAENPARTVYEALGFRFRREVQLVIVRPPAP
jgi:predicted GNAT family acetyltransferase